MRRLRSLLAELLPYRPCYARAGSLKTRVNPTVAHRDHLHIGMTRAGANAQTSFRPRHTG